jgi:hypothetical protein
LSNRGIVYARKLKARVLDAKCTGLVEGSPEPRKPWIKLSPQGVQGARARFRPLIKLLKEKNRILAFSELSSLQPATIPHGSKEIAIYVGAAVKAGFVRTHENMVELLPGIE